MSAQTISSSRPRLRVARDWVAPLRTLGLCALVLYAALLGFALVGRLGFAIRLAADPHELMYGEAIIYEQAARLTHALPLYQAIGQPSFSATAYGPLYYWMAAGLQTLVGPGFTAGRALSIGAGLVAAGLVSFLAMQRARSVSAGLLAGALFLVGGFRADDPWFAFYKEDMVGVALALGAVVVLSSGASSQRVVVAGVLAALAVLTKQTLLAAAVTGFVCLLPRGWRPVSLFVTTVATVVVGTTVVLELSTHAFLTNTIALNVNPFSREALASNLATLVKYQAAQMLLAGLFLATEPRNLVRVKMDPLLIYGALSIVPLVGLAKVGSNYNYWIELAAVLSVLATLGLWKITRRELRRGHHLLELLVTIVLVGGLCAEIVIHVRSNAVSNFRSAFDVAASREQAAVASEEFRPLVERVRNEPGAVLADPLDVLPLADRPILLEPYLFSILSAEGRWNPQPVVDRICRGDIRLLVLGYPIETAGQTGYQGFAQWPPSVVAALQAVMKLESQIDGRFVYSRDAALSPETKRCR